jgi:hypothetical protein
MKIPERKLFCVLIAFVIIGCSGDELDLNIKPFTAKYLVGKLKTYNKIDKTTNKSIKTEFFYTEKEAIEKIKVNNLVEGFDSEESFVYGTDGKVLSSSYIINKGTNTEKFQRAYTYDKNGMLTELKETKDASNVINYLFFEYNANNKVTDYYNRQVIGSANKFKSSAVFTWKGDNLSIVEDSFEDGTIEETENLFDDKVNPLNEIYTKYLKFPSTKLEYASKNNITATKKLFEGTRYKIESTYDAKDISFLRVNCRL